MLTAAVAGVVDHPCIKHAWGSTTAVYTAVSSEFRNQALRRALDRAFRGDDQKEG